MATVSMAEGREHRFITGRFSVRNHIIHLINPKTDSLTTRPIYLIGRYTLRLPGCLPLRHVSRATGTKSYSLTKTSRRSISI